jgi:hypothetical protein
MQRKDMRKFILIVLTGIGLMLAVPQFSSAAPIGPGGLGLVADNLANTENVWHRRWHRRYVRYRCWHRRYYSGRRCVWW